MTNRKITPSFWPRKSPIDPSDIVAKLDIQQPYPCLYEEQVQNYDNRFYKDQWSNKPLLCHIFIKHMAKLHCCKMDNISWLIVSMWTFEDFKSSGNGTRSFCPRKWRKCVFKDVEFFAFTFGQATRRILTKSPRCDGINMYNILNVANQGSCSRSILLLWPACGFGLGKEIAYIEP